MKKLTKMIVPAAMAVSGLVMAACGAGAPTPGASAAGGGGAAAGGTTTKGGQPTLMIDATPAGPQARNFNPFVPTNAGSMLGAETLIYEPLLYFNVIKPGPAIPWLATGYRWSDGGKTLTFQIRKGVTFTNGDPLTSADVAYTFDTIKKYPSTNVNGLDLTSVSTSGRYTAVLKFKAPAYTDLEYVGQTDIVPAAVWSKISNPSTYDDSHPIGSGPYTLSTFNNQGFTLVKQNHYWQPGKPAVKAVDFEIFDSQPSDNAALESGTVDWGGVFLNNIKTAFVAKDPQHRKYWQPGDATVGLFPNLTEAPLNSLPVRQAVSLAINRSEVSADGENGQEAPALSATGLVVPADNAYLDAATSRDKLSASPNVAAARSVLEKAGYTMGRGGYFQKDGKTLAFTITDCTNYSDYMTDMQVIAANLKQAGMDVTVKGVSVADFSADVNDGNFQAMIRWGTPGSTPYYQYDNWLDSNLTAPVGKSASGDYERFHSAAAQRYLAAFAKAGTPGAQKAAMIGLEKIEATQLPVIPLVYSAAWDQYNTSRFTGFPSASDPYFIGTPQQAPSGAEYVLLHLKPVS